MFLKYLFWALSAVFAVTKREGPTESVSLKIETIKQTIRDEFSEMSFKFFIGVVLSSMVVFSVVQLGLALETYLGQFTYGLLMVSVIFASIAAAASVGLYLLFKKPKLKPELELTVRPSAPRPFSFLNLANDFSDGFKRGLDLQHRQKRSRGREFKSEFNSEVH